MYFVYILKSRIDDSMYVGCTKNLKRRFFEHNNGGVRYTKRKRPLKLIWFSCFVSKKQAYSFEKYLKSSSGHAFRNKRLI